MIKEYLLNVYAINNAISIDLVGGKTTIYDGNQPNWKVHLVDTGLRTQSGGRVKRLRKWFRDDETFMLTYGDDVADLDIGALVKFHHSHGKLATMTSVRSPARFGRITFAGDQVTEFVEKPQAAKGHVLFVSPPWSA